MNKIDLAQGSTQWKEWRKSMIMATDSSVILGINEYKTPYRLWSEKLSLVEEWQQSFAASEGSRLEPIAREYFISEIGFNVEPAIVISSSHLWMGASLDGISDCGKYAVEIKCSRKIYEKAMKNEIDEMYLCQMQHQMFVLDIPLIYFYAYWDEKTKLIEVVRYDEHIKKIIEKGFVFWKENIKGMFPPELTERDFEERYDDEFRFYSNVYLQSKKLLDVYEKQTETARLQLIDLCKGKSCKGFGIKVSKVVRKGNVEYKSIPELNNVDLECYRKKPIETYRITEE